MKKFITLALALILTLSMAVCIFAEDQEISTNGGQATAEVTGKYVSSTAADQIIVSVNWTGDDWVYTVGKVWNKDTFQYDETAGSWSNANPTTVTITSKSSTTLYLTYSATADAVLGQGAEITLSKTTDTLARPTTVATTTSVAVTGIVGKLTSAQTTATKIGTITVTVSLTPPANLE